MIFLRFSSSIYVVKGTIQDKKLKPEINFIQKGFCELAWTQSPSRVFYEKCFLLWETILNSNVYILATLFFLSLSINIKPVFTE